MGNDDRRRTIPRTDALLALPAVVEAPTSTSQLAKVTPFGNDRSTSPTRTEGSGWLLN